MPPGADAIVGVTSAGDTSSYISESLQLLNLDLR